MSSLASNSSTSSTPALPFQSSLSRLPNCVCLLPMLSRLGLIIFRAPKSGQVVLCGRTRASPSLQPPSSSLGPLVLSLPSRFSPQPLPPAKMSSMTWSALGSPDAQVSSAARVLRYNSRSSSPVSRSVGLGVAEQIRVEEMVCWCYIRL